MTITRKPAAFEQPDPGNHFRNQVEIVPSFDVFAHPRRYVNDAVAIQEEAAVHHLAGAKTFAMRYPATVLENDLAAVRIETDR